MSNEAIKIQRMADRLLIKWKNLYNINMYVYWGINNCSEFISEKSKEYVFVYTFVADAYNAQNDLTPLRYEFFTPVIAYSGTDSFVPKFIEKIEEVLKTLGIYEELAVSKIVTMLNPFFGVIDAFCKDSVFNRAIITQTVDQLVRLSSRPFQQFEANGQNYIDLSDEFLQTNECHKPLSGRPRVRRTENAK
jgi:hypothetical protein